MPYGAVMTFERPDIIRPPSERLSYFLGPDDITLEIIQPPPVSGVAAGGGTGAAATLTTCVTAAWAPVLSVTSSRTVKLPAALGVIEAVAASLALLKSVTMPPVLVML